MYIKNFEDLQVWQKAYQLTLKIYKEIKMPPEEKYGLDSQLKRAAVSVPANIAEASRRLYRKEPYRFLSIALGSLSEVRFYIIMCKDLGYISEAKFKELNSMCIELDRMLDSFANKARPNNNSSYKDD